MYVCMYVDNLSPLDSNIACLCQSIEINNNKYACMYVLPQSRGREFDPRLVHDNLSVPLWVYMRFPVPEHQN